MYFEVSEIIALIAIVGVPVALICLALLKDSPPLKIVGVIMLVLGLMWRESALTLYPRHLVDVSHLGGDALDQYMVGVRAVTDYLDITSLYVYAVSVLLVVLCIRGFRPQKTKSQSRDSNK